MILSYLRTSFRNLFRHRLYTLVNIFGLAVGMAACILVGSLVVLVIAFCTISFQAIRAARANPVDALRYE